MISAKRALPSTAGGRAERLMAALPACTSARALPRALGSLASSSSTRTLGVVPVQPRGSGAPRTVSVRAAAQQTETMELTEENVEKVLDEVNLRTSASTVVCARRVP